MHAFPIALLLLLLVAPSISQAHDDPHKQIQFLSQRMKREGRTTALLFARARLHLKAEHWRAARRDLQHVLRTDPQNVHAQVAIGEAELHMRRFRAAERTLETVLKTRPDSRRATLLLAEVYRARHKYAKAASLMETLIRQGEAPPANLFLDQAELLQRAGKKKEATAAIDRGIQEHGPLATLLARGLSLRDEAPKKVRYEWLAKHEGTRHMTPSLRLDLAELAAHVQKPGQANAQLEQVLKHLTALPNGRRHADAIRNLEARVRELNRRFKNAK